MRKNFILCVVICFCICLMPCTAYAASTADANEPIITSAECSLTLNYVHGENTFPDIPVQLYCISTASSDFQYTLTEAFRSSGLIVNGVSSTSEWNAMRTTLESFIVSNKLIPDQTEITNNLGFIEFNGLVPGLYFVMPVQFSEDGVYYYFDSALVAVPTLNKEGVWEYDVTATPKPSIDIPTGDEEEYKVVKLWRDNGNSENRPTSIVVDIICNGKIVESVTLSGDNNWSYSWTAADNGDVWQVTEQTIPEGYIMTVEEHSTSFTIINTVPGTPDPPQTGDSSNIGLHIMLMCISGLMLVILGATAKRKAE